MPNNRIQSLTVNGVTYDIVDNTSGYINVQYIENKTDYEIPVSRAGEIVVGETAIGTDSTNFPTSKAVVDYVDERVVQEMDAIDVGVIGIKANGTSLAVENGIVNIPVIGPGQLVGLMTGEYMSDIYNYINDLGNQIPTSTSQLTNDSGFITISDIPIVPTKTSDLTNDSGFITSDSDEKLKIIEIETTSQESTYYPIVGIGSNAAVRQYENSFKYSTVDTPNTGSGVGTSILTLGNQIIYTGTSSGNKKNRTGVIRLYGYGDKSVEIRPGNQTANHTVTFPNQTGTIALTSDIPTVPTNISSFTNDSGYLTASDIASVMTYKGTKANYAALPSSGNVTGDVWHLTDTGAEWAWDGSAWQELGTAIDLSGYVIAEQEYDGGYYFIQQGYNDESGIEIGYFKSGNNTGLYILDEYVHIMGDDINFEGIHIGPTASNWNPTNDNDFTTKVYVDDSIGAISIPTKTSDLTNDSGFLTSYTETDPTVPSWAKQSSKPSYALSEITSADDIKAIEALTGTTGLLRKTAANTWSLDTNTYLTSYTETDPTVPSWAKQSTKPSYTAAEVGALPDSTTIPSKTSDLTNDSGFITSDSDEKVNQTASTSSTAQPILFRNNVTSGTGNSTEAVRYVNTVTVTPSTGTITATKVNGYTLAGACAKTVDTSISAASTSTSLPTSAAVASFVEGKGYLTSYTETDPVFSASAAAGITSTDISNWNAKVSDDKTWNGVTLNKDASMSGDGYIPGRSAKSSTSASNYFTSNTPTAYAIASYTSEAYLRSTTPPANDNSIKVATTAYVDAAIPKVYSSTNTGGYLTMATLPIYDGTVV